MPIKPLVSKNSAINKQQLKLHTLVFWKIVSQLTNNKSEKLHGI